MRPKRKNVCQQCRSRKLACDGKSPACSQCALRRVSCSGYQQEFQFVSSSSGTRKQTDLNNSSKTISNCQQQISADTDNNSRLTRGLHVASRVGEPVLLEPSKHQRLQDDIHYILQHYAPASSFDPAEFNPFHNQICGAWVEALPYVSMTEENTTFLVFAVKTLATSLRCLSPTAKASKSHAFEMYCKSLGLLSQTLKEAQGVFQIEHCVAIMCLAVSDMMNPDLGSGWAIHMNGVRNWMESLGPKPFRSGILRTLFIGFRPLMLTTSILNRQTTFLAQEVWTTTPFRKQNIPMIQELLSEASKIPSLLERFDNTRGSVEQADFTAMGTLWQDFRIVLERLSEWESEQWSQAPSPLFWAKSTPRPSAPSDAKDLWFLNLMVANSLTHCWAFKIITKLHLRMLGTALAARKEDDAQRSLHISFESKPEKSVATLAGMICDSMTYLLQPEMKLYGPTSTFFTLHTAIQVFKGNSDEHCVQISRCQQIVAQLAALGLQPPKVRLNLDAQENQEHYAYCFARPFLTTILQSYLLVELRPVCPFADESSVFSNSMRGRRADSPLKRRDGKSTRGRLLTL